MIFSTACNGISASFRKKSTPSSCYRSVKRNLIRYLQGVHEVCVFKSNVVLNFANLVLYLKSCRDTCNSILQLHSRFLTAMVNLGTYFFDKSTQTSFCSQRTGSRFVCLLLDLVHTHTLITAPLGKPFSCFFFVWQYIIISHTCLRSWQHIATNNNNAAWKLRDAKISRTLFLDPKNANSMFS